MDAVIHQALVALADASRSPDGDERVVALLCELAEIALVDLHRLANAAEKLAAAKQN